MGYRTCFMKCPPKNIIFYWELSFRVHLFEPKRSGYFACNHCKEMVFKKGFCENFYFCFLDFVILLPLFLVISVLKTIICMLLWVSLIKFHKGLKIYKGLKMISLTWSIAQFFLTLTTLVVFIGRGNNWVWYSKTMIFFIFSSLGSWRTQRSAEPTNKNDWISAQVWTCLG